MTHQKYNFADNYKQPTKTLHITKMLKVNAQVVDLLVSLTDQTKGQMIRAIRDFKVKKTPIKLTVHGSEKYILNVLKQFGIEGELAEAEQVEEVSPIKDYLTQRERLKQFPELEYHLKKLGLIIRFCTNCDCLDWTSLGDAFVWSLTEEGEAFWVNVAIKTKQKPEGILRFTTIPKYISGQQLKTFEYAL